MVHRRHCFDLEVSDPDGLALGEPDRLDAAPLSGDVHDPGGAEDGRADRLQRLLVEVVAVLMRGEDGVHEREPLRGDHASCDPDVRPVRLRVLAGERVGEVRVDQQVVTLELHEEPALAEPPDAEPRFDARRLDVCQERIVGEEGLLH